MSRNPDGRQFIHTQQYQKAHIFEEIQELYKVACLEYGYSPIKFTRGKGGPNNFNSDYGLCSEVIEWAKKIRDAGGGHISFSTIPEKEARQNGGYSYCVCKGHNRAGTDYDSCRSSDRDSYIACGRS